MKSLAEVIRCPVCSNVDWLKVKCEHCHYAGWIFDDGTLVTSAFGETEKWRKQEAKALAKQEAEKAKALAKQEAEKAKTGFLL